MEPSSAIAQSSFLFFLISSETYKALLAPEREFHKMKMFSLELEIIMLCQNDKRDTYILAP